MRGKLDFKLDRRLCKSCGICWSLCPRGVLEPDGQMKPAAVNADKCLGCGLCEYRCPDFAIRIGVR